MGGGGGLLIICDRWPPKFSIGRCVCGGGGGRAELFTCPYPLKVQARPLRDQRLATQSRVSWREEKEGAIVILKTIENHEWSLKKQKS